MKTIAKRLLKLELAFAPPPDIETWGRMAPFRDELLRDAEQGGPN